MPQLVQIIYISKSTVPPVNPSNGVDPGVARILAKSRANNRKNGLVGVLYFGDGCFFQCLEGEEHAVDTLYAKLEQDPRHRELKIISRKHIAAPTFQDWSMKYVPIEHDMTALLRRRGMATFDPYQFDDDATREVIGLLHAAVDPEAGQAAPAAAPAAPAPAPVSAPVSARPAPALPAGGMSGMQMGAAAVIALAVVGVLVATIAG